jgi:nitrogen fixation/metabolism regulation signal transduction histidine kinase
MSFNRFGIRILILSVLIGLTGTLFIWTLFQEYLLMTRFTTGILWVGLILWLLYDVNRTNRSLNQFLQTIKTLDNSRSVRKGNKDSFDLLGITCNEILESIQKVKIEKESEYQYFRSVFENASTGLITFDQEGHIGLINRAACELLEMGAPSYITDLDKKVEGLSEILKDLKAQVTSLNKVIISGEMISLSIRKAIFVTQSREISLISLQNIRNELEVEELEVWQKLIAVLTHEIMNSVSPIKSLTDTLISRVDKLEDRQEKEDMLSGLSAIQIRSRGMLSFVDAYRNLTRIPSPDFREVQVARLVTETATLMKGEMDKHQIRLDTKVESEDICLHADEKLLSQVLINLIGNAVFALADVTEKRIEISAFLDEKGRKMLRVKDNGHGIPPAIIDKIFIPFYTTREKGSGIGLSLSRQIMHMHNASISVQSPPGAGTTFTLVF